MPETECPLNDDTSEQLKTRVNPLGQSDDFGINIYLEHVNIITN